jgi:hypothetical protein
MNPKIWGPHAWIFLHSITFNYPNNPSNEVKKQYKIFFESLQFVLPCDVCKSNYKKKLITLKINEEILSCRKNLIKWLIQIHNQVNKSNNKRIMSNDEVLKYYVDLYDNKPINLIKNTFSITPNLIAIFSTIIIALYFIKKKYLL